MHEIDLKNFSLRTDVILEQIEDINSEFIIHNKKCDNDIKIDEVIVQKDINNYKKGIYKTISFNDITDKDNFKMVENALISELKDLLDKLNISNKDSSLIIGLGNHLSTPDSLGPKVIDNVLVTRYLFDIGDIEEGYRNTASFKPGVTGSTGIETRDLIKGVVDISKPDFLIIIDALASSKIERVNKTIQISDVGILPGSGVGNSRKEINKDTFGIPVIAIGVPTIVDAVTIVYDTFEFMKKQIGFKLENINNSKLKFVKNPNYLNTNRDLTYEEKEKTLGIVGTLSEEELKELLIEVLSPINYNLMVTPKEIDFVIDKLSLLISNGINKALHEAYNSTK